jgi:hypothetical protein
MDIAISNEGVNENLMKLYSTVTGIDSFMYTQDYEGG